MTFPSRSASGSPSGRKPIGGVVAAMTYPHPMDIAEAEDREANLMEFLCQTCGFTFHLHPDEYDGQWDHPPAEPECPSCQDRRENPTMWHNGALRPDR